MLQEQSEQTYFMANLIKGDRPLRLIILEIFSVK